MPGFKHDRQRTSRGHVDGSILDPETTLRVRYETKRKRLGGGTDGPMVSWSACGSVPVEAARVYAVQILKACAAAEVEPRPFEPNDEVTYDTLKPGRKAFLLSISDDGFMGEVEHGVVGEEWQETRYVETIDLAKLGRA